jgi:hypothetical protein
MMEVSIAPEPAADWRFSRWLSTLVLFSGFVDSCVLFGQGCSTVFVLTVTCAVSWVPK